MESADGATVAGDHTSGNQKSELLNAVFGGLRAEYFREEVFDLFTHPAYFPQLQTVRPCLLVGGRGTGKTTVLKCLSYEGQAHLNARTPIADWTFIGLYWRIDTSIVRAFEGPEISTDEWTRLFSHYVNLTLVGLILDFVDWHGVSTSSQLDISANKLQKCATSLGLEEASTIEDLRLSVDHALLALEVAVNNLRQNQLPTISILGRPLQYLIEALSFSGPFTHKTYFFLIDEFENLSDYQQRVFNTLIKHAGDHPYTFKIGMRETGHRERSTINPNERLIDPADYALIDINDRLDDASFASFARQVCESRLQRLRPHFPVLDTVDELFTSLSEEAEALKLGVADLNAATRERLAAGEVDDIKLSSFDSLSPLSAYLVSYWSESQDLPLPAVLDEAIEQSDKWDNRLNNYQHAMLYTIRRRKRGWKKYYSGWTTYTKLADGNIRYLLELVHEAFQRQLRESDNGLEVALSPELQTAAATAIGERAVEQLRGASANGASLTRLVLGLGRVFGVMAAQPYGHTPEVSQFGLSSSPDEAAEELLTSAVMHLAVRRFTTDKMAAISGQIKDYSYQLHPIFAPFFVYSYRSKRRMDLSPKDLLGLVNDPKKTIPAILRKTKRSPDEELPSQLMMFRGYFDDAN